MARIGNQHHLVASAGWQLNMNALISSCSEQDFFFGPVTRPLLFSIAILEEHRNVSTMVVFRYIKDSITSKHRSFVTDTEKEEEKRQKVEIFFQVQVLVPIGGMLI